MYNRSRAILWITIMTVIVLSSSTIGILLVGAQESLPESVAFGTEAGLIVLPTLALGIILIYLYTCQRLSANN
jgi:hypothetical protein